MSEMIVKFHCDERGAARTWDEVGKLVRCKDCKHWEGEYRNGFWYFEQCSLNEHVASSDDFCSWAERREE